MENVKRYRCDNFDKETVHAPISVFRQDFDTAPCICGGMYRLCSQVSDEVKLDNVPVIYSLLRKE